MNDEVENITSREKPFDIKERSFLFALDVVLACREIQQSEKEFILSKQLLRSGTAVGALIREAHNGESTKDFIHKLAIAQKECDESIYWIDLIITAKVNAHLNLSALKSEAEQLLKIIRTIILNKKANMK
jgi:four helix bundle protein